MTSSINGSVHQFIQAVSLPKTSGKLEISGNLCTRSIRNKKESSISEIQKFVKNVITQETYISAEDLKKLTQSYNAIATKKIHWYHRLLSGFSKKYAQIVNFSQQLTTLRQQRLDNEKAIEKMVTDHLTPYFEGKITQKNDDTTRKPLIEKITLPNPNLQARPVVEKVLCKYYLTLAAKDFLTKYGKGADTESLKSAFLNAAKFDFSKEFCEKTEVIDSLLKDAIISAQK